jgi:hypothetical protein
LPLLSKPTRKIIRDSAHDNASQQPKRSHGGYVQSAGFGPFQLLVKVLIGFAALLLLLLDGLLLPPNILLGFVLESRKFIPDRVEISFQNGNAFFKGRVGPGPDAEGWPLEGRSESQTVGHESYDAPPVQGAAVPPPADLLPEGRMVEKLAGLTDSEPDRTYARKLQYEPGIADDVLLWPPDQNRPRDNKGSKN